MRRCIVAGTGVQTCKAASAGRFCRAKIFKGTRVYDETFSVGRFGID